MLLDILLRTLGKPRHNYAKASVLEYNCPKCAEENGDEPDNKFNLGVTLQPNKHIYNCWKCGYRGKVHYMLKKYGSKEDYKAYMDYNLIDIGETTEKKKNTYVTLPREFIPFTEMDKSNIEHLEAYNYVINDRKISDNTLRYLNVGFCLDGWYKGRIIFPSYNRFKKLNFFIARSFRKEVKPSYDASKVEKKEIILNESNINWNHPIYLVEGYPDLTTIPLNTIPLAGKVLTQHLMERIIENKSSVIIILDPDAKNNSIDIEEQLKLFNVDYVINIHLKEEGVIDGKKTLLDLNEIHRHKSIDDVKKYLVK